MRPFTVIGEVLADDALLSYPVIELLIDRLVVSDDKTLKSRLADSAETAFLKGTIPVSSVSTHPKERL